MDSEAKQVKHSVTHIAHDIAKSHVGQGIENLVKHPGKTAEAVATVAGSALETAAGGVTFAATWETGIGAVVGVAAGADGVNQTVAGAKDLASLFNGHPEQVGTHNFIENQARKYGGAGGAAAYDIASFGLGLVSPLSDVTRLGQLAKGAQEVASITEKAIGAASRDRGIARSFLRGIEKQYAFAGSIPADGGHVVDPATIEKGSSTMYAKASEDTSSMGADAAATKDTGEALSTQSLADKVASELGGNVSKIDGDVNSWKVNIPNGKRPIIFRIMEAGSSGRANPYFRVSVDGKPALTLEGKFSSDHGLTHFDLSNESVQQILNIIDKYRGR